VESKKIEELRAFGPTGVEIDAVGGGRETMCKVTPMTSREKHPFTLTFFSLLLFACAYAILYESPTSAQQQQKPTDTAHPAKKAADAQLAQKTFPSAQAAADAFVQAAESWDVGALNQILGPHGEDLVSSEDPVRDKNIAAHFSAEAREKTLLSVDPKNPNRASLVVGNDDWPMPIPIVKRNGVWLFDTKSGKQEILDRRIGANELDAIQICRGYVEAQEEYALEKHDGSEVNQYAQKIISTPGKHDGLVWRNPDGSLGGPIAENIADALQQGYSDKGKPYHGYFFKILKGQGPAAPLGKMDFLVEGAMIGGFALAAAPAEYRVTGVMTFIVSYQGVVYQKDLGPDTLKIFQYMQLYNPDKSWQPTNDNWPTQSSDAPVSEAGN
jgi:hypothetical protein